MVPAARQTVPLSARGGLLLDSRWETDTSLLAGQSPEGPLLVE